MKNLARFVFLGSVLFLMAGATFAQNASGPENEKTQDHSMKHIVGCLQNGDKTGEYTIANPNRVVFTLQSKDVNLSEFVGQQVRVNGRWADEQTTETPANPNAAQENPGDHGKAGKDSGFTSTRMDVKSVRVISKACTTN